MKERQSQTIAELREFLQVIREEKEYFIREKGENRYELTKEDGVIGDHVAKYVFDNFVPEYVRPKTDMLIFHEKQPWISK